jgi:hypothetical protein
MAGSAWTNQLTSLILLSAALSGFSGFFAYSPAPGTGNLIVSVTAAAGEDPYSDEYLQGVATYGPGFASAMIGGAVIWYTGSLASGWSEVAVIEVDLSGDLLISTSTGTIQLDSDAVAGSNFTVDGTLFVGGASGGSLTATNFNMNPTMGTPVNQGAVNGGTATLAQLNAWAASVYSEMKNRGMFN